MSALAPTLQAFFTDRLIRQRQASPNTIAAYRDAFKLLLGFASQRAGMPPSQLDVADLDATMIAAFLDHLEADRHNSVRSRNARLAAIRSLFRFAALRHPEHAAVIARVLAIPPKRFDRALISYLTGPRDRRAARRPRQDHLDRPSRPHPADPRDPDRPAAVRADRAALRRPPPRHGRARRLPRQRPQGPHHPADTRHRRCAPRLADRTRWAPRRSAVLLPPRHATVTRRHRTAPRDPHRSRHGRLPNAARQEVHRPRAAPHPTARQG
jgi:hypothetical protein